MEVAMISERLKKMACRMGKNPINKEDAVSPNFIVWICSLILQFQSACGVTGRYVLSDVVSR